jgi:hypothetical protein
MGRAGGRACLRWASPTTTRTQETPIRRSLTLLIAVAALAALALPALAGDPTVNVPKKFASLIPKVSRKSGLDVLLPERVRSYVKPSRTRASGSATRSRYDLVLGAAPNCNGANVCVIAFFSGERGGKPSYSRKVKLTNGITGYYKPLTCGGSCSPPLVQWVQNGALYEIQFKGSDAKHEKQVVVGLANSAIKHGKR